jgi:omega-amidase
MKDLRVSIVQAETVWLNLAANVSLYTNLIAPLRGMTDLIVLPETFLSGFSNDTHAAIALDAGPLQAMREMAAQAQAVVTGSVAVSDGVSVFNRLIWMRPDGSFEQYDKRHLFRMAKEHERYGAGKDRLIVELHGWRICPMVCYDLRFPVFIRNTFENDQADSRDYDALIFVANWPSARAHAWKTLLRARAIENLSYCIGVNRVGVDGNQLYYAGDSVVLDYLGQAIVECADQPQVISTQLSWQALQDFRTRFPAFLDADAFEIIQ